MSMSALNLQYRIRLGDLNNRISRGKVNGRYSEHSYLVARLCMDSVIFKSVVKVGPHTTLAYSKCGLTKDYKV